MSQIIRKLREEIADKSVKEQIQFWLSAVAEQRSKMKIPVVWASCIQTLPFWYAEWDRNIKSAGDNYSESLLCDIDEMLEMTYDFNHYYPKTNEDTENSIIFMEAQAEKMRARFMTNSYVDQPIYFHKQDIIKEWFYDWDAILKLKLEKTKPLGDIYGSMLNLIQLTQYSEYE